MWPKLVRKATYIDFQPLGSPDIEVPLENRARCLEKLVNVAIVITQCLLLTVIIFSLLKVSLVFGKNFGGGNVGHSKTLDLLEPRFAIMFEDFTKRYKKVYVNDEETNYRFSVFVKNVMYFEEEEKKNPGLDLDVTRFADWTEEEMRKFLSSDQREIHVEGGNMNENVPLMESERPAAVDWVSAGKVTSVKDQGQCGSCWAFATVASVESVYAIKNNKLLTLSEQEMVDCDSRNNGCSGGYRPYAMNFVMERGLMKESEYPYLGTDHNECRLINSTERIHIRNYRTLSSNEEAIAEWIASKGPVTFGMNVTKALYSYRSGIFTPTKEDCEEHSLGSHALTFVGYGSEAGQPYWLVKNSWGAMWGQNGYFKLARGRNSCGAANNVVGPLL